MPAWITILISLIVGLGGGVIGAVIAASNQTKLAREARRATAQAALWTFQRTIRDLATEEELHEIRDGTYAFTNTKPDDLAAARAAAYPFRGYLAQARRRLLERVWIDDYDPRVDPLRRSDDLDNWAKDLEQAILDSFVKDSS